MKLRTLCGVMVLAALALTFLVLPFVDAHQAVAALPHPAVGLAVIAMAGAPSGVLAEMRKHAMPSVSIPALILNGPAGLIGSVRNDAQNIEKLLTDVRQELQRVGDDVKRTAEDALKQSKDSGTLSAEVKQKADELLMTQGKLSAAQDKLSEKLEALETRSTDIEQKMAARRGGGGGDAAKSLGQMVAESDDVKNFVERSGAKGSVRIVVQNAITSAAGSGGDLISPQRDTEIVGIPRRQMTVRQLLQVGRTTSNSIEYARQLARTNNAAVVAETLQKPESNYTWELDDAPVRTIAHWVPVSRQAMDDIPQLQSEIDGELRYGLDLAEELELLKG
ncbi:MAG: phage major capsid protein, partial [Zymomonas sp.]